MQLEGEADIAILGKVKAKARLECMVQKGPYLPILFYSMVNKINLNLYLKKKMLSQKSNNWKKITSVFWLLKIENFQIIINRIS